MRRTRFDWLRDAGNSFRSVHAFRVTTVDHQRPPRDYRFRSGTGLVLLCSILSLLLNPRPLSAAEWEDAQKLYLKGQYAECIRLSKDAVKERFANEEWSIWLTKSLLETGQYREAQSVITNALTRSSRNLRARLLAHEVFLQNGQTESAKELLIEISQIAGMRRWLNDDSATLIALGRAALLLGAEPRLVLENFYNQVKKADPAYRETYLAIGQLALDKNDSSLAAKSFQEGLVRFPTDPEMLYGLAKAFSSGDRAKMIESLEAALKQNEKHTPSLLLMTDHAIDAEEYEEANGTLEKILKVNPYHPEAWAYRAVLSHLNTEPEQEAKARERALQYWKTNPQVPHLIGQKLSQKYRFAEGSEYQRQAIRWNGDFLPAKIQLAQDLLRLGEDAEGWKLADEVYTKDAYDIVAYNLVTLHENLSKFQNLTNQDFILRMHPHEAAIYGQRALGLLRRAKATLCEKYGMELERPTVVEIFPEQKDFAVRTFGMPGGEGYLGVCFGHVITANSPASQKGNPSSWEAVLWHEFCHVVTLSLTKNKMPRWLSEGISVFEELEASRSWGQQMNPRYREMILKGELTPISELSGAFLTPKTSLHLQFAYYESALVVEFLVKQFGLDSLKRILKDLGQGKPINQTIEAHTVAMAKLEKDFDAFARKRAEQLGQGLEWKKPDAEDLAADDKNPLDKYPKNFWVLTQYAKKLLSEKKWEEAKGPIQTLLQYYPEQTGSDSGHNLMAEVHRGLNETDLERQALSKQAEIDAEAVDAYLRLMELDSIARDWTGVATNAARFLAVNPLVPTPHRYLARASEELGQSQPAIESYQILLKLDPPDLAEVHFRLAKLQHQAGDLSAKRHILQALEEAPRFREAHQLLLAIAEKEPAKDPSTNRPPALPEVPKP
jgi:tetratricopeptide (TPR) repeat protein